MSHHVFNGSFRLLFSEGNSASGKAAALQFSGDLKNLLHSIAQESLFSRENHQLAQLRSLFISELSALFLPEYQPASHLALIKAFNKLEDLTQGIFLVSECSAKSVRELECIITDLALQLLKQYQEQCIEHVQFIPG